MRRFPIVALLLCSALAFGNPMIAEFEAQLRAAEEAGITGPEIDQLRELLRQVKADEAASQAAETEQQRSSNPDANEPEGASAAPAATDRGGNDRFHYVSPDGEPKTLNVDKTQRERFAGLYANEYRDPAVADFRYRLHADGTASLEHRVCENCTHELDGERSSQGWQPQHRALAWAPMVTDDGEPMERNVRDMNGETHRARVLVVALEAGGVMSLSHYRDGARPALGGPYGVPRYLQE